MAQAGPLARYREMRARARSNRPLDLTWRIAVLVVGVALFVAGIAMLALPGPGWATIFLALAVLSTEFAWARRLMHRVRDRAQLARAKAKHPAYRRRMRRLAAIATAAAAAVVALYWWRWGFPGPAADVWREITR